MYGKLFGETGNLKKTGSSKPTKRTPGSVENVSHVKNGDPQGF